MAMRTAIGTAIESSLLRALFLMSDFSDSLVKGSKHSTLKSVSNIERIPYSFLTLLMGRRWKLHDLLLTLGEVSWQVPKHLNPQKHQRQSPETLRFTHIFQYVDVSPRYLGFLIFLALHTVTRMSLQQWTSLMSCLVGINLSFYINAEHEIVPIGFGGCA